jgi:hypothetical protein
MKLNKQIKSEVKMKNLIIVFFIILLSSFIYINKDKPTKVKASLLGSKQSLQKQNTIANREGLTRITDSIQLEFFVKMQLLVPIREDNTLRIDSLLPCKHRYVRPITALFLGDLSINYYKKFLISIKVSSAVRTIESQKELCKINQNAAPATGPMSSTHTTGATIDISYIDMTDEQKKWVRDYLLYYEAQNCIEATEEKSQAVFHIMVFSNYNKIQKMSPYVK